MNKLTKEFYIQDALTLAPLLLGKLLCRRLDNGDIIKYRITETESYFGEEDSACHAHKGKTNRTMTLYEKGGICYIYLCYGLHYLFNIVTGQKDHPEAVLIRCVENYNGPAKLTKAMNITKELNNTSITSDKIWIEDDNYKVEYITDKRVGIDYANEPYKSIHWRFILKK
jgi:DNA-3-methyladenine glycosylase